MCDDCAGINIITLGCCCNKANINCSAKLVALKRKYFRLLRYQKRLILGDAACEMDIVDAFGRRIRGLPESQSFKAAFILITQQAYV